MCLKSSLADERLKKIETRKKAVGRVLQIIMARKTGFGNWLKATQRKLE